MGGMEHYLAVFGLLCWSCVQSYHILEAIDIISENSLHFAANMSSRPTFDEFQRMRDAFFRDENSRSLGADVHLNPDEEKVNAMIMKLKSDDLRKGLKNPKDFIPSRHLFEVLKDINKSAIFKIFRQMPKGGVLHAHDTAVCNLDFVVKLTYWDNLWQTVTGSDKKYPQYRFSRQMPSDGQQWVLVKEERARVGAILYDSNLRKSLTLFNDDPINTYRDVDSIWVRFMEIFSILSGIVEFKDAWAAYWRKALEEFYDDGVQYVEIRSVLPALYDLDGNKYDEEAVVQIYYDTTEEYKRGNPEFIGAKVIYAPLRNADDAGFLRYLNVCINLHEKFPNFMAGFDLVGQEDLGRPLINFAEKMLTLPPSIKFYFHAGETNWSGETDNNLIDAVLLGSRRIGHGFALVKHPEVLEYIKAKGIAVELNPISNQVLRLVADYRNHPAAVLFSDNYPVVVSCDDPSFWDTKPLSHDFYQAFVGIASSNQDLRFLKKLALNSIEYSAMTEQEKTRAVELWTKAWNKFIEKMLDPSQQMAELQISH